MEAFVTVSILYSITSALSCAGYYLHLKDSYSPIPRLRLTAFSLLYPAVWTGFSVITAALGVYYQLLPNSDRALALAACISVFPAAAATHFGID